MLWKLLSHFGALFGVQTIDYTRQDETVRELVEWSKDKGGSFHPNVEIRRWNTSDPSSYFGVFLDGPVQKDDLLIQIPGQIKLQLHPDFWTNSSINDEVNCELAWFLKREYDLGDDSTYAPYINYIKAQSKRQIPAMWSNMGKKLLEKVQGDMVVRDLVADEDDGSHLHSWIKDWYGGDNCLEDKVTNQVLDEWYMAMARQRGYDYTLIPIYDMVNHNNGDINTITRPSIFDKDGFGVYALRDMQAGEELFYSYYDCPDCRGCETCGSSLSYWGTPEMLRDFGFVEPYPHKYQSYDDDESAIAFMVDEDGNVSCENKCPDKDLIEKFHSKLLPVLERDVLPMKANYHHKSFS